MADLRLGVALILFFFPLARQPSFLLLRRHHYKLWSCFYFSPILLFDTDDWLRFPYLCLFLAEVSRTDCPILDLETKLLAKVEGPQSQLRLREGCDLAPGKDCLIDTNGLVAAVSSHIPALADDLSEELVSFVEEFFLCFPVWPRVVACLPDSSKM